MNEPLANHDAPVMNAEKEFKQSQLSTYINQLTFDFKKRFLIDKLSQALPWLLIFSLVVFFLVNDQQWAYLFVLVSFLTANLFIYLWYKRSLGYQSITRANVLFHLNRKFPQFQESAQLTFQKTETLNPLQQIQQKKVLKNLEELIKSKQKIVPKLAIKVPLLKSMLVILIATLTMIVTKTIEQKITRAQQQSDKITATTDIEAIKILSSHITVVSPNYTQLPKVNNNKLDIHFLEGSTIFWRLAFSLPQLSYQITFADGRVIPLKKLENDHFVAQQTLVNTGIYKISSTDNRFTVLYTLTSTPDEKPKIRILSPKSTVSEIAKNGKAVLDTQVSIRDDFGFDKIEILASVAKGSGEGVKFRDQTFTFDKKTPGDNGELFIKHWNLKDLGMEPGDELYFTVKAWDNKAPTKQLTRSVTKIIRWLEDEEQGIQANGLLIDFMPEYFKSQRQIIIETIELIDDKQELTKEKFNETSELLGVAQSSLKEKYGQYLGDEFESGNLENSAAAHVATDHKASHESVEHEGDETHGNDVNKGHHHDEGNGDGADSFEMKNFGTDRSGYTEQMTRFGHNHGDADIGIINKQDPKALMKRSIASMWQAELHLMLSEPQKALPFEESALKFLNMARKAERIYVKRLGFEPPPVSEQRRYQGELNDILSYHKDEKVVLPDSDSKKLSVLFKLLHQEKVFERELTNPQVETLNHANQVLKNLLSVRPSLIKSVATIEKMIIANSLYLDDCPKCVNNLTSKLWQMLPTELAQPSSNKATYSKQNLLYQQYGEFLELSQ